MSIVTVGVPKGSKQTALSSKIRPESGVAAIEQLVSNAEKMYDPHSTLKAVLNISLTPSFDSLAHSMSLNLSSQSN